MLHKCYDKYVDGFCEETNPHMHITDVYIILSPFCYGERNDSVFLQKNEGCI